MDVQVLQKNRTRKPVTIVLALCLLILASCGYRFAGGGDAIDHSIQSVYVEAFTNETSEALVENHVRNAFVSEFRQSGRFSIAGSAGEADATLSGSVRQVRTSRATYTTADSAVEDRVSMRLDVRFVTVKDEVLWSQSTLTGSETFRVGDDPGFTERNRTEALRKLAADLARQAYRGIMTGF